MELQAFNDIMKTMFSNKENEYLLYKRCGEALGCAFTVEEMKECGKTSRCCLCSLRESVLISYMEKKAVYKQKISREFYKHSGEKVLKHLQFSTRPFYFENDYYIITIINDITLSELKDEKIKQLQSKQRK
jgi:sigma-B regulation protein RsbU (phosphoserine phosphatase)